MCEGTAGVWRLTLICCILQAAGKGSACSVVTMILADVRCRVRSASAPFDPFWPADVSTCSFEESRVEADEDPGPLLFLGAAGR